MGTGITIYLLAVLAWFYLQYPVEVLMPMFFADPAGAIVGKFCSHYFKELNPRWHGTKTIAGSSAVFVVAIATLGYRCSIPAKMLIGLGCVFAEAFGGTFDNLTLGLIVLGGWIFCATDDSGFKLLIPESVIECVSVACAACIEGELSAVFNTSYCLGSEMALT